MEIEQMTVRMGEMAAEIERLQSLLEQESQESIKASCRVAALEMELDAQQSPAVAVPEDIQYLIDRVRKWGIENTGNEPSLSCFHRALDELVEALMKSPRITEQDAREILIQFPKWWADSTHTHYDFAVEVWLQNEGRALLAKLNEVNNEKAN